MRRFIGIALFLYCLLPAHAQKQYSLQQYLNIRSAAGASLSPDGQEVTFLSRITGTGQVWKVGRNGGWPEQLTFFSSGAASATWSPTEKQLLVSADTDGNEQFQLYLLKGDGTDLVPLTNNPKVRHSFGGWTDDGKQIFYTSNARDPRYFDCYLMDIATRQARIVFQKDAVLGAEAVSPDGKYLIASEATSNVNQNLYLVDVATGQGRLLTPHEGDAEFNVIGFGPFDNILYLATDLGREFTNLATMDLRTGKITYLQDVKADIASAQITPDRRVLVYTTNRDGYTDLAFLDLKTKRALRAPTLPRGLVSLGGFSANSRTLALSLNTPTRNTDVWLLDMASGKFWQVTFSSTAGIDRATFVEPTLIKYRSFDGLEIPAFLYVPQNARPDRSTPVIVSVHGGPEAQEQPGFASLYQYFVSRGYAVLAPNIRGSSGYGKTYLAMDNARKRWDALKDLAALVEWVGTKPELDVKKVAIFGGSYGGFAVLAMLVHYPDLFAAGVDVVGISDFKTFLANTAPFRRPLRIAEYGDPVIDSEFMDQISPARHVARIKAPLMVIQGANDPRVPASESTQIVEKVRAKGGIVEYQLFPDEGHGVAKLSNRIIAYERMVAFLDRHLRGKSAASAAP
jgi:dipeptidyl aminopeptidase/acylaminoacyl peptidase